MFTPEKINLANLPKLWLKEKSKLPVMAGIYFVTNTVDEIQYIGCSKNLRSRWSRHHLLKYLTVHDIKIIYLIDEQYTFSRLLEMEKALIKYFKPPLNMVHNPLVMHNANSLANLKLGASSRYSGRQRHCYTVKPETHNLLAAGGNASIKLDELVGEILAGELVDINEARVLEAELDRLKLENKRLKEKG